jgi:hypothetical protein
VNRLPAPGGGGKRTADENPAPWAAWRGNAPQLTAWADIHTVNRRDAWGTYLHPRARVGADGQPRRDISLTAPPVRDRGQRLLSLATLERHFRAAHGGDVIGTHSTSPQNTSLWGLVDVDHHGDSSTPPRSTSGRPRRGTPNWSASGCGRC